MSISVMDRVWRCSRASQGQLLVLLAIADFANDSGEAWPSVPTLAKKSRLKERQTQYVIGNLVRSGELKISKNKGPRGCHLYRIIISDTTGAENAPVHKLRGAVDGTRGALDGTLGVHSTAPEPSVNRHKNRHSAVQKEVDAEFIAQQQVNFPHLNVEQEAGNARAWISVRPGRKMTPRFFVDWLKNDNRKQAVGKEEAW